MILPLVRHFRSTNLFKKNTQINLGSYAGCTRQIFQWLNIVFNQIDPVRVKEVGPNRACAEWLLRNGASVRWVGCPKYLRDYNALPSENVLCHISEVDATNSSISHYGFMHFKGCNSVKKVILHDCGYIEDEALRELGLFLNKSLEELEISQCGNITDNGLRMLKELKNLKKLNIMNLPYVKEPKSILHQLKDFLPHCDISFDQENGNDEPVKMKRQM